MADVDVTPGTWGWWLQRLEKQLDAELEPIARLRRYYDGDHPLAFASEKFRKSFGGLFGAFADNWTALVADAVEERLNVEGFRFGKDPKADEKAWAIWQANQLDADSQLAHQEALVCGRSAAIVWWGDDGASPLITVEPADQVKVAFVPGNRRERAAAVKRWVDDDDFELATLYLPDFIYKFRSQAKRRSAGTGKGVRRWEIREVEGERWPLANPLGVVPVVPLLNRPRLSGGCESEIANVLPIQDAVNKLVADMLIASEFGAFRQRWVTGMDIPIDPETRQPVEPFKNAVDRLWMAEEQDAKFGEFEQTDLTNFVKAIEMLVQHAASQTRTPPHYFYLSGQFPSGESLRAAETGLVAKARRKQRSFGESWEEVMRLAFRVAGEKRRAGFVGAETIWRDPESRTESEFADALMKRQALGVPNPQLWEDLGYTPQQIARFNQMLQDAPEPPPSPDGEPTDAAATA